MTNNETRRWTTEELELIALDCDHYVAVYDSPDDGARQGADAGDVIRQLLADLAEARNFKDEILEQHRANEKRLYERVAELQDRLRPLAPDEQEWLLNIMPNLPESFHAQYSAMMHRLYGELYRLRNPLPSGD